MRLCSFRRGEEEGGGVVRRDGTSSFSSISETDRSMGALLPFSADPLVRLNQILVNRFHVQKRNISRQYA